MDRPDLVKRALQLLNKQHLLLAIHDGSFPSDDSEEIGRGTPNGMGGKAFVQFLADLGFSGIQLGPQGRTSVGNASPYDGTLFSRNPLSFSGSALVADEELTGVLPEEVLNAAVESTRRRVRARAADDRDAPARNRVDYRTAYKVQESMIRTACERFPGSGGARKEFDRFCEQHRSWLAPDALYHLLSHRYGTEEWATWSSEIDRLLFSPPPSLRPLAAKRIGQLEAEYARDIELYELEQFILHRQHDAFHRDASARGIRIFADLQIGFSLCDSWRLQQLFLPGYRLGAPPSRTNPDGQPWNFFIYDPDSASETDQFMQVRVAKLFSEFDGLRIDHPQGLVCPWVYRADNPDPLSAVQNGARLYESPHRRDHPALARFAIPAPGQLALNAGIPEYADGWVTTLDESQVDDYSRLIDVLVTTAQSRGFGSTEIACEILSTLPYPLKRVIDRYGIGRFRVTQKADLSDPGNVYRSENAEEKDWVMLGNHDTPPIRAVIGRWRDDGAIEERSRYLAQRLSGAESLFGAGSTNALAEMLKQDERLLIQAQTADLFVSPARNVSIFFADLFGLEETYNVPGTIDPENWSLRVPPDYATSFPLRSRELDAMNLPYVLAVALHAECAPVAPANREEAHRLAIALRRSAFER